MSEQRIPDWIRLVNPAALEAASSASGAAGTLPSGGSHAVTVTVEPLPSGQPDNLRRTRLRQRPETRAQLLERLVNPQISLHEASILLKVCPATVRSYTRSGRLPDLRTPGGQRRFRFRDVMLLARELDLKK